MSGNPQYARWAPIGLIGILVVAAATPLTRSVPHAPAIGLRRSDSARQTTAREPAKAGGQEAPISFDLEFYMRPGDSGVLILGGNDFESFGLYVQAGKAVLAYQNVLQNKPVTVTSDDLPTGTVNLRFELGAKEQLKLEPCRRIRMFVNGACVGRTPRIKHSSANDGPLKSHPRTEESLERLLPEYTFTGEIRKVEPHRAAAR